MKVCEIPSLKPRAKKSLNSPTLFLSVDTPESHSSSFYNVLSVASEDKIVL